MSARLPWHNTVLRRLASQRAENRLPAAILLDCPEGWGVDELLTAAVCQILELTEQQSLTEFAHPDLFWAQVDGAALKVEQSRELISFATKTRQIAPRKVAAVPHAHLLNTNAANAMLKILEEPPPATHIVLATSYRSRLLPTIRSRCQVYSVQRDVTSALHWLQDQNQMVTPTEFAISGYAPLRFVAGERFDIAGWVEQLGSERNRAACVKAVLEGDVLAILGDWLRWILWQQRQRPQRRQLAFAKELAETRYNIEHSNAANTRLLVERLTTYWQRIA